jgi:hypothetical protein
MKSARLGRKESKSGRKGYFENLVAFDGRALIVRVICWGSDV